MILFTDPQLISHTQTHTQTPDLSSILRHTLTQTHTADFSRIHKYTQTQKHTLTADLAHIEIHT